MQTKLDGKVAIVTGSARGIGRAYARGLAAAGAAVLVADLLEDGGRETVQAIVDDGGSAAFQRVDVTDLDSTELMAATATSEFGGVDILVNNAAMLATLRTGAFSDIEVDRWDRTMAVNVKGAWLCIRAVVPSMRERGGGVIVNQSSISAFGLAGLLDYAASKAALIGLTKNLALELGADNIRVNAIAPGGVMTQAVATVTADPDFSVMSERAKAKQAIGGPMEVDDLVGTMLYLVSEASGFMTGQTLVVDGGRFFLG